MDAIDEYGDIDLRECRCCGRKFKPDVLSKHEPICLKNSKKKRKVFDSGKQRAEGSDVPLNKTLKPGQIPKPDAKLLAAQNRTKNWRQRHEQLVQSLKAARQYSHAKETGAPLPPPPPATIDPSLVLCPYCQRRFNEKASERHIPFCKEQQARINPKGANKKPLFKAPLPKSKTPASQPAPSKPVSNTRLPTNQNAPPRTVTNKNPRSTPTTSIPSNRNNQGANNSANVGSYKSTPINGSSSSNITGIRKPTPTQTGVRKPSRPTASIPAPTTSSSTAAFCHECGSPFSIASARFCSECGVRRLNI